MERCIRVHVCYQSVNSATFSACNTLTLSLEPFSRQRGHIPGQLRVSNVCVCKKVPGREMGSHLSTHGVTVCTHCCRGHFLAFRYNKALEQKKMTQNYITCQGAPLLPFLPPVLPSFWTFSWSKGIIRYYLSKIPQTYKVNFCWTFITALII